MNINCQPNKTEVICFSTAERDNDLVPITFNLGRQKIHRVSSTKVLGLILDEKLTFTEHSNSVQRKLMGKWVTISRFTNRFWGFKQHTMVQLLKTLWFSSLFYAGHIWISQHTIKDINKMFYRILKTTVGAVFNIRQSIAEVIVGLPPILLVNDVNRIKHYLKLNMSVTPGDRLKEFIQMELNAENKASEVHHSLKQVYRYLTWKISKHPKYFTSADRDIILNQNLKQLKQTLYLS